MYDIKYKPGQRYWGIHKVNKHIKTEDDCHVCEGYGYYETLGTRSRISCQECDGSGKEFKFMPVWDIWYDKKISHIEIDEIDGETIIRYCSELGADLSQNIGKTIFFSEKEAQLMCDKLNKEEK